MKDKYDSIDPDLLAKEVLKEIHSPEGKKQLKTL